MVVYIISGTTKKKEDLNLYSLRNGKFLSVSSVLYETIELSHICLKEKERRAGMSCIDGEREFFSNYK